ncbi:MAG: NAD(P)H-dependent oxidoreductase [Kordiimonadaceae bacterium]|nr:NAD(P)H-dependent oxidoreductase [Kordiimonadaceae bacterium]
MKLLAFAASNSKQSINKKLATYAANLFKKHHKETTVEILDINDYEMPLYSVDKEAELGQPIEAKRFLEKIGNADALIVSFAEHNGTYTAAYKNLFDWVSRIEGKFFQNKPMVLLATAPGPGGAASVLATAETSAPFFGSDVKASLSVPNFYEVFDTDTLVMRDTETDKKLKETVAALLKS